MYDFDFCVDTNFIFGRGAQARIGAELAKIGASRVLIHHDSGRFLTETGLLQGICEDLQKHNIAYAELGGVKPNPRLTLIHQGIDLAREEKIDFVLAIGGGSVIDSAKAIAAGALYSGDVWDFYTQNLPVQAALSIGVLLTNPATSSESNGTSMVNNEEKGEKRMLITPYIRPKIAFMNPELTFSIPRFVTACSITDMFSHVCERYFSPDEEIGVTDRMEEGVLKTLLDIGPKLMEEPGDYFLRANAMWIGTIAHNNTLSVGRRTDWATHLLGNELSALYDTPHAATLSIIMGSWMRYVYKQKPLRFARYAKEVFGINWDGQNTLQAAQEGIEATEAFFKSMGMPVSFADYKVPTDAVEDMLDRIPFEGEDASIGGIVRLSRADAKVIFEMAF
ncbi:MAG: iron-containing alcohol dehydrogenase [Oscillospiraceae bacterium]